MLEDAKKEKCRKIAFSLIKSLQGQIALEVLERAGGVNEFFDSSTRLLWEKIGAQKGFCTDKSRDGLLKAAEEELKFVEANNVEALFITDEDYPFALRECEDAPTMLYKLGNCNLNSKHIISIVGTRKATAYGQRFCADLVGELSEKLDDIVIVSGLAYGIDVAAHRAALNSGVPTVGVVAHGLKTIYPADHRDVAARIIKNGGALLTEYISSAPIHRGNFLARNRIVAGMSGCTIIVESEEKGGAMVTASIAFAYGREVAAPPGRVTDQYSAGPLKLIKSQRASLIRNADDLIELMNWTPKSSLNPKIEFSDNLKRLNPDQNKIVEFLRTHERSTVNDMVEALSIPYSTLSARLMELEMDDIVNALPGSAYSLNI